VARAACIPPTGRETHAATVDGRPGCLRRETPLRRDGTIIPLEHLANILPALHNQQVDALSSRPPLPEQLKDGTAALLADPVAKHVGRINKPSFMALAVDKDYLATHRDLAHRVVHAITAAQRVLGVDKETGTPGAGSR
jgi:hypothetical protein